MDPTSGLTPTDGKGQTPGLIIRFFQGCKECLTEKDNRTHDPWKWSLLFSMTAIFLHDYWQLRHGVEVNVRDFALAIMAIVTGHGIGKGASSNGN